MIFLLKEMFEKCREFTSNKLAKNPDICPKNRNTNQYQRKSSNVAKKGSIDLIKLNVNEKNNIKSRENRAFRKPNETTIYKKEKNISILKSEIKKICDDYLSKEQFALIKTMHIG